MAAADALQVAQTALGRWREAPLNDLWNVAGVVGGLGYGAEGMPYITSHYGYYMSAWHLVFALSGQSFDAPSGSLAFAPKLSPPFSLPVLTPKTVASIAATADGRFTLRVRAGKPLRLSAVRVGEVAAPAGVVPAVLGPGESITWKRERDLPRRASHTVVPRTRVLIR
jgi:non-lysosomal glucosylceramidase